MELGEKPELKFLPITKLYIDPLYQRNAKTAGGLKNIAHMKENFSWAHCGALVVAYIPEKKQYAVIDGQHRLIVALERTDIPELPCVVLNDRDFQRQAQSFVAINTKRVGLNNIAAYHASVIAGEENAVRLDKIIKACGLVIPSSPMSSNETPHDHVQCVSTIIKLFQKYSDDEIKKTLIVIHEAHGIKKGQLRSSIIRALVEFIHQNPDCDRDRLKQVLKTHEIDTIEKDARSYVTISGGSQTKAIVTMLDRMYKNTRSEKIKKPVAVVMKPVSKSQPEKMLKSTDEGTLSERHWPEMQEKLRKGCPINILATQYKDFATKNQLERFIDRHILAGARQVDKKTKL